MTDQPTPEELGRRMRDFDNTAPDADDRMRAIIADAEAGGNAHMLAVVDALPKETAPAPPRPDDIMFDVKTRRASYRDDQLNVTLSLIVRIDDRRFEAREVLDPFMWDMQFSKSKDHFETFIGYFLRRALGAAATDSHMFGYFRSKLFIVTPHDSHDRRVCRRTNEEDNAPWPRCVDGAILSEPPVKDPFPLDQQLFGSMFGPRVRPQAVKGACDCRCHPEWMLENVTYGLRTSTYRD